MANSKEVKNMVRESLGIEPIQEPASSFPVEGHTCDFPFWSYSKKRAGIKHMRIDYDDGSFFELKAPEGMPGPSFPGYLDVMLFLGQRDLFTQGYIEISVYRLLRMLGLDPNHGGAYKNFRRDMSKSFSVTLETDRFRDPKTGMRSHTTYFRILNSMEISKNRKRVSRFHFNEIFLESYRAEYLRRLDLDFCLELAKSNKALARFLYAHILKRLGSNPMYIRNFSGFLNDVGLEHLTQLATKNRNQKVKETLHPALDLVRGKAFSHYELDDQKNIVFFSKPV